MAECASTRWIARTLRVLDLLESKNVAVGRRCPGRWLDWIVDIRALTDQWPLSGVAVGDRLAGFETREVVRIHSDQGDFVVKSDPAPRPDVRDDDQLLVLDFAAEHGYPHAPSVLHTRNGHRAARTSGGLTVVLEFVPQPVDQGSWTALGRGAATLNRSRAFPVPYAIPFHAAISDLARQAVGRPFERDFAQLLDRVSRLDGDERRGLIHGEINLANARCRNDGTVVLLDWDQAGSAPVALEYGYPLITQFLSEDALVVDEHAASDFYAGYLENGGTLDPASGFSAALFHALRYMWFGNVEVRWERIVHALRHEADLTDMLVP